MIWLIGAGNMAIEYARVLTALKEEFLVVGRSNASAQTFTEATGLPVHTDGNLKTLPHAEFAIVATSVNQLFPATLALIEQGVPNILAEKPGALSSSDATRLSNAALEVGAKLYIAYNRRFYAATTAARAMLSDDGGTTSWHAELTEWSHRIDLSTAPEVLSRWFIANTSHVVDLAWHLAGPASSMHCQQAGTLDWHPSGSIFCGAGKTDLGALFSYNGNWQSAGRWSLELSSAKRRLILRPMEQLQIQPLGSINIEDVNLDDRLDQDFKPGLYRQTESFLRGDDQWLCTIDEQITSLATYEKMAGYE